MEALGVYFATLRGTKSRAKLAAELGVSEMSILRIESRGQEPGPEMLVKLVGQLRARWEDVEYLLGLDKGKGIEEGRQLAENLARQIQQAGAVDARRAALNRLIADLEADPRKIDRLLGYGQRLLEEDRSRE